METDLGQRTAKVHRQLLVRKLMDFKGTFTKSLHTHISYIFALAQKGLVILGIGMSLAPTGAANFIRIHLPLPLSLLHRSQSDHRANILMTGNQIKVALERVQGAS